MGLSGSAFNMFLFINRKSDIELDLSKLSMDKSQLTRDMEKVSLEYQSALTQKTYKWSNNSGASYVDLSYNNMMKPSAMNLKKPYLLTDLHDRVVVDSEYKKYAEMISPDGAAGGDWYGNRDKILAELTGVSDADLAKQAELEADIYAKEEVLNAAKSRKPDKYEYMEKDSIEGILANTSLGGVTTVNPRESSENFSVGSSWLEAYQKEATINIGENYTDFEYIVNNLMQEFAKIFPEKKDELDDIENTYLTANQPTAGVNSNALSLNTKSEYIVNVKGLIDDLMAFVGEYASDNTNCNHDKYYYWEPGKYDEYNDLYTDWEANDLKPAQEAYDNAVKEFNELFAGEDETLIDFYDAIFSSIAEKGWTYNPSVQDGDYVEQMLLNNVYTITTVDRKAEHNDEERTCEYKNKYDTSFAGNFGKLFLVNDSEATQEALAEYEYKKSIISRKESEIDTRMNTLNTELSAVKTMLEQMKEVANKNIERTMEFSA